MRDKMNRAQIEMLLWVWFVLGVIAFVVYATSR